MHIQWTRADDREHAWAGLIIVAGLFAVVATGCAENLQAYPPRLETHGDTLELASRAVDDLKWYADAYGGASMTNPLLVQPDDRFKFDLTISADTFFNNEREQISGRMAGMLGSAAVSGARFAATADVGAMQQYAAALAQFKHNQSILNRKQALLNDAASREYDAAVEAAKSIADPVAKAKAEADAARRLAEQLGNPGGDAATSYPTAPAASSLPTASDVANRAAPLLPTMAPAQGLYAEKTPSVSGETRAALLMAAGDTATAAMLNLLLDPSKVTKFAGKRVLFGVSMVSVMPGWKTRAGYSVDLQGQFNYKWTLARDVVRDAFLGQKSTSAIEQQALSELQRCVVDTLAAPSPPPPPKEERKRNDMDPSRCVADPCDPAPPFDAPLFFNHVFRQPSEIEPVVAAASPMGETQSLDLQAAARTIRQRALEMALALQLAGLNAQTSGFQNLANLQEEDLETRLADVVVNAYGSPGGIFGFRIYPRLAADPRATSKKPASAHVLSVPTYPTLLVLGTDDTEIRARVLVSKAGQPRRCVVVEPRLEFGTWTNWVTIEEACKGKNADGARCYGREMTNEEVVQAARTARRLIHNALREGDEKLCNDRDQECEYRHKAAHHLDGEANLFLNSLVGSYQEVWLPAELIVPNPKTPKPKVTAIGPSAIELVLDEGGVVKNGDVKLVVAGDDLDQLDLTNIAGPGLEKVTAKTSGKGLELSFRVRQPGVYVFGLPIKNTNNAIVTPPLTVTAPRNVLTIKRTISGKTKDGGGDDKLTITPGVPADVVKAEIEKNKILPADVKVDVQTAAHSGATKAAR